MFRGYKLKFEFNAAHSNLENHVENAHFHTFTIVLYLHDLNEQMDYFFDIEKSIQEWLAPFRDCYLHETELFQGRSTTLESIGDTFFDALSPMLKKSDFDLVRLDVFENPIRMYSVSDRILDADVNELGTLPQAFYDAIEFEQPAHSVAAVAPEKKTEKQKVDPESLQGSFEEAAEERQWDDNILKLSVVEYKPGIGKRVATVLGLMAAVCFGAWFVMYLLHGWGTYPAGSDTYCHLYRADVILQNIREGNLFPLYDPYWYNGVEIMRYWGPVPLYVLAFMQSVGGDMFAGYIGYVGVLFVLGALGWIMFGYRQERIGMGLFVGCIWFFLPENMKVLFYDGNLPRALINALLPYLICFVYDLLKEKRAAHILKLTLLFCLISLCHIGTTIMLVAVLFIYLLIYGKVNKEYVTIGHVVLCVTAGMLLCGIWMVPSLHGSGAGGSNNQVMEGFFQDALLSLNPFPAWDGQTLFYFGLSLFVLCVVGLVFGTKETMPGFAVGLIIFLLTSNSAYDILSKLPFSSVLWMMRFVSLALSFVMAALLLWKGLKRHFVVFLCILLVIDCLPVLRYLHSGTENVMSVEEKNKAYGEEILFNQAKEITDQRMTVFDLSGYGAFAPYYAAGTDRKVLYMFGAGWEGARTAENIVMLNTAVETGKYEYVFDRCIEMGTDTVLFVVQNLQNKESDLERLTLAGEKFGYEVAAQSEKNILMHRDTPECYGTVTDYPYLAIGSAANEIALLYPGFEEGRSENLSEYTFEELSAYECIYLNAFTYDDKAGAEKVLTDLADNGVRVYIDMNKAPVDRGTNVQEMFGVSVQTITFHNSFPVIQYEGNSYKTSGFPGEYKEWKANYLIGLQKITGKGDINNKELAFSGTNGNDNIVFLGYNFIYYTQLTNDGAARNLVSEVFGIDESEIPERKIVPLEIEFKNNRIEIRSERDGVNTSLANISDIFRSDREYEEKNHMITVSAGKTVIEMEYPYFWQGVMGTFAGLCMLTAMMIYFRRYKRSDVL
nr:6-carboxytetrahydropterin synthase [Lachnospiraceae bacterium]